jgi:single stranded DNA-binding protein
MANLNRVTISGYLACDPVHSVLPYGTSVCDICIACHRKHRNKLTGVWKDRVDYVDARAIGPLAPVLYERLHTGNGVAIDGRLSSAPSQCEHPDHRSKVIIVIEDIQFIPKATTTRASDPVGGEVLVEDDQTARGKDDAASAIDVLPRIDALSGSVPLTSPLES